jgi:hypothetical protein
MSLMLFFALASATPTQSKLHFHTIKIQIYNEMVSTQMEAIFGFPAQVPNTKAC